MLNNVSETTHHVATYIVNNSFLCKKYLSQKIMLLFYCNLRYLKISFNNLFY